jgi:nucleotidyltransferase substrate binding protein (TIGR01987 family)
MFELRWQQRFENFEKAFLLLESAVRDSAKREFSDLENEGFIQRFEFTFELAWKTLKDYLNYSGISVNTPREAIKEAFANNIIKDGQAFIDMLEDRNLMSHVYDKSKAEDAVKKITCHYFAALSELYKTLKQKI